MRLMAFIEIEIMNSQMTFRIRSETRKAIQQIAKYRELSESDIVREAIREKLQLSTGKGNPQCSPELK